MKIKTPVIKVEKSYNRLRIYIDDIIHLSLHHDWETKLSIQSYMTGKDNYYSIDYHFDGQVIETGYTRQDIWEAILSKLKEQNFI